jgi:hypothetical protein
MRRAYRPAAAAFSALVIADRHPLPGSSPGTAPPARAAPRCAEELRVSWTVYGAAKDLVGRYATKGVEGVRHGHVLVIGDVEQVLACGHLQGQNDFSDPDKHGIAVHDTEGAEVIRRRMNTDGMTVIDGLTGVVHVNHFFSNHRSSSPVSHLLSRGKCGSQALWLSDCCSQCVVFEISKDGRVTEYQSGRGVEVDPSTLSTDQYCDYCY